MARVIYREDFGIELRNKHKSPELTGPIFWIRTGKGIKHPEPELELVPFTHADGRWARMFLIDPGDPPGSGVYTDWAFNDTHQFDIHTMDSDKYPRIAIPNWSTH